MTKCFEIPISLRNHCLILGIKARYARVLLNNESILVFFQQYVWINHWCSLMTSSLLCVSFMIGGVGLGVEEEVCSAIKGDISPLFCCDEEKKIDNHATFKPCIVLDCHSLLPKQSFKLQLSSATGEEHPQMCIRHRQNSKRARVGTAVDF